MIESEAEGTSMEVDEDAKTRMNQLLNTVQSATRSLERFCEANGLHPQAWFKVRGSDSDQARDSREPQDRISDDRVR